MLHKKMSTPKRTYENKVLTHHAGQQFHSSVIIALNHFVYTEMKKNEIIPILALLTKQTSTLGLGLDEKTISLRFKLSRGL